MRYFSETEFDGKRAHVGAIVIARGGSRTIGAGIIDYIDRDDSVYVVLLATGERWCFDFERTTALDVHELSWESWTWPPEAP